MKKRLFRTVSLLLAVVLLVGLVGCNDSGNGGGSDANLEKYASLRYDEPITIKIGIYDTGEEGWNATDNEFIDLCLDVLNIKIEAAWSLPWAEHTEKVKLAAATNSLPDTFVVHNNDLFLQMVENETIADLTAAYNSESGAYLRSVYETYPDSAPLKEVTYNNKLYAFPSTVFNGQHALLWVRQDWLDTLNMDRPSTLDEVFDVARAFVNNDPDGNGKKDTIGIPYSRWLLGANNRSGSIDPIYYALGAYPGKWFQDENGKVYYGTVTQEMKAAVGVVANAAKEGIINPFSDGSTEVSSGKCGMFFGPWWMPTGMLTSIHESDPEANWVALNAPLNKEGKFVVPKESTIDFGHGMVAVRSGYEHPEAVARILYLWNELTNKQDEELVKAYKGQELPSGFTCPLNPQISRMDTLYNHYEELIALGSADPTTLSVADRKEYDLYQEYQTNAAGMSTSEWGSINAYLVGCSILKDDNIQYISPCIGQLDAKMLTAFGDFHKYTMDAIFEIVGGAKELDAFDQLFGDFETMGGKETAELIEESLKK